MKPGLFLLLLVIVLVACRGSGVDAVAERQPVRATLPEPKACRADEVQRLVRDFIAAFNNGDSGTLDALFAPYPYFRWYSTPAPGKRIKAAGRRRATLIPYFVARRRAGERLRLTSFRFNGNSAGGGEDLARYGNFEYGLVRSADDLPPTDYYGKGASYCFSARADLIFVWSMAPDR